MKKETISSLQNPLVKGWRALNKSRAERMQAGLFLAEGDHLAGEALKEGKALALLLAEDCQEKYAHLLRAAGALPVYLLSGHVMGAICDAKTPQGAAALCAYPQEDAPLQGDWLIALDGVQDPGNVGAVLRTADAFGCTGALLLPGCADPYSLKTLRASMGAVFRLPLYAVTLPQLSALLDGAGLPLYGTALRHDTVDVRSRDLRRCALVIGSEGQGARAETLALCRETLRIPMTPHCESLNAAAAAAVLLWEAYRAEEGN